MRAYRYLRKELAANLHILVRAEEISSLKDWIMALQKVEEALGGESAEDLEYPLDKIAKMLNESN